MKKYAPQLGTLVDVFSIMDIFIACTDAMLAAGIKQWNYTYPTPEVVKKDILRKELFVIKEADKCMATITINDVQDAQYQAIKWNFDASKVMVIHRLAVHPEAQGKGFGKKLCLLAEKQALLHDFGVIRLDAYSKNTISNRLYERLGYQEAEGYCYFHDNDIPFKCYEKRIIEK